MTRRPTGRGRPATRPAPAVVGVKGEGKKYSWTKDAETESDVDK